MLLWFLIRREQTHRHIEFPEYKVNRQKMPEAIQVAIPHVKSILSAFRIKEYSVPGYEADDVIGTIAKKLEKEGNSTVFMVTPDKDYAQLVSDKVLIVPSPKNGQCS